ncbi:hypothetical protein V2I01_34695 [Micromonospora sp. BRA006-A]|nr:hypothetical protein [Micromonospora sp. BRA006-A]
MTVGRRARSAGYDWGYDQLPEGRTLVALTPPDGVEDRLGLLTLTPTPIGRWTDGWGDVWPAVLPGHRGVVAAHLLPEVAGAAQEDTLGHAAALPVLAECTARADRPSIWRWPTGCALATRRTGWPRSTRC